MWELLNMINPINHSNDKDFMRKYKVEPYVVAADIYATPNHKGRGGWTWYTGSAGWMYQLIIEYVFGLKREADFLILEPCLPLHWETAIVRYRYKQSTYIIQMHQHSNEHDHVLINVDEFELEDNRIQLIDDGKEHVVEVKIGEKVKVNS
jgi:cellobiose phosphorylase